MATTKNFNLKDEAVKLPFAAVGALDLVVERFRTVSTDVQTRASDVDLKPEALVEQARGVVKTRVEEAIDTVESRRKYIEKRVEQGVNDSVAVYGDLATRGEKLVDRIRNGEETKAAVKQASSTKSQAKGATTATKNKADSAVSATKGAAKRDGDVEAKAKTTAKTAKTTAKKTATTAKSGAKGTTTSAKKTAAKTTEAASAAAKKVGD